MNKKLWKLSKISDRLWIVAMDTAQQAAVLGEYGRGLAVVADEARHMAIKLERAVERALFEEGDINDESFTESATELSYLALNCAIEASRLWERGKGAAVCADEIRNLGLALTDVLSPEAKHERYHPHPKDCITSVVRNQEYLCFRIGDLVVSESLGNVREVLGPGVKRTETHISFREQTVRLVDPFRLMGAAKDAASYVILQTPWAEQNKTYAVAVDGVTGLYFSPVGKPADAPADLPLAAYVRECWDGEDGEPIVFMDWPKML